MRSVLASLLVLFACAAKAEETIIVASKKFTESVILGELARLSAPGGLPVEHRRQLGGSRVVFEAALRGDIDVYPDYTGTLRHEILKIGHDGDLAAALAEHGLEATAPLGFNNTYVLAMRPKQARRLGIARISDLVAHPALALGFSNEFMNRADGWPGLSREYNLPQQDVRGLDHDLAYRGVAGGDIDVIDAFSTDPDIRYYDLTLLADDRDFFPEYAALYVYRKDLRQRAPELVEALHALAGRIDAPTMRRLNGSVKLERRTETATAADFLGIAAADEERPWWSRVFQRSIEHLVLVAISLTAAIAVAIPAGVLAFRRPRIGQVLLSTAGLLQTIPALALLVMLIPLLGIGTVPAIVTLFVYSLLPILRNTHAGLAGIPGPLRESALALGLPPGFRLRHVELPLARGSILAGIKTAAVINVGTATLGALIGAGGYGQPILTGIRLDDTGLILEGAVPAAALALILQLSFDALERRMTPTGLRSS